jgi:hypothetical protein
MKNVLTILFLIVSKFVFSQAPQTYLTEREQLYINHEDISTKDNAYSIEHGDVLPALVKKEVSDNLIIYTFTTHRNLNDDNRERWMYRFQTLVPSIVSISSVGKEIKVRFSNTATQEDFVEFFRLTGYSGFKIMN